MTGTAAQSRDLDSEVDCLLSLQPEYSPFLHPSWLRAWYDEFGNDREAIFLTATDDSPLAFAPLMREDDRLTFLGDSSVCDFMDILVDPARQDEGYSRIWQQIRDQEWSELVLWGLREGSPTPAAITELARAAGYRATVEHEAVAPRLALAPSWEEYLGSLGKKDRHELRRKMRRLGDGGALVDLKVVSEQGEVSEALEEFLALHIASRQDKAEFMSGAMPDFFRRMASSVAAAGLLRLFMLHINNKPAASVLCFDAGSCLYLYNSGYDPALADLSVGLVSKALCLRWAIENGKKAIDFLRGNEPYKYDLGATDQEILTLTVRR